MRSFPPGHIPRELGFKSRLSIGQRTTGVFFSFARWKSVFFYMCTGQTSFSPLTSAKPIAGCGAGREFAASDRVPETAVGLCRWVLPWGAGALGRWAGMLPSSVVL